MVYRGVSIICNGGYLLCYPKQASKPVSKTGLCLTGGVLVWGFLAKMLAKISPWEIPYLALSM